MMLLRFRFENHKSFRDPTELTMVQSRLKTNRPIEGDWTDYTLKVAGIYGANASGKSSVLDALSFMVSVVRRSATTWAARPTLRQHPFALDEVSSDKPSHYALDFVIDGIRHEYGFSHDKTAILSEWLYDYPVGRRRLLFERGLAGDNSYRFGRTLKGSLAATEKFTGDRELFLSRAAISKNPGLKVIFDALTKGITFARFDEDDRSSRMHKIVEGLASGDIAMEDLVTLLQVADVGIGEVEISTQEVSPLIRSMIEAMLAVQKKDRESRAKHQKAAESADEDGLSSDSIAKITTNLSFRHRGDGGNYYALEAVDQSTGTLSWLSLAVPAVEALREGSLLLVDELDASLHPQLGQVLIKMFKDEHLNPFGAQLIFTTHDTYFLSASSDVRLSPEEVWFAQKDNFGMSELYSLGDFETRKDENQYRRYLNGRYGGTPSVAPSFLLNIIHTKAEDALSDDSDTTLEVSEK